ncbi:MAG: hypothetical protein R3B38_01025 [Patescibacteria group bacterium]
MRGSKVRRPKSRTIKWIIFIVILIAASAYGRRINVAWEEYNTDPAETSILQDFLDGKGSAQLPERNFWTPVVHGAIEQMTYDGKYVKVSIFGDPKTYRCTKGGITIQKYDGNTGYLAIKQWHSWEEETSRWIEMILILPRGDGAMLNTALKHAVAYDKGYPNQLLTMTCTIPQANDE